ncbi:hypothetical protein HELRODRAFT_184009 [Helobdella robusta]|uniref:Uncharacterized protein n=1 Tax=Helobdella robusta TaxID=6412 RepID=T1FKF0_HELRO|nr:hypothetical protein HELRODRAFT_184009 [Helobdella robusta]ESO09619.1 hypothetical protein HELRODRAFT_184009 [Helobdella robusta]
MAGKEQELEFTCLARWKDGDDFATVGIVEEIMLQQQNSQQQQQKFFQQSFYLLKMKRTDSIIFASLAPTSLRFPPATNHQVHVDMELTEAESILIEQGHPMVNIQQRAIGILPTDKF